MTSDLSQVGAFLPVRGDSTAPQPDSDDPIFPGVLVRIQNWERGDRLHQNTLWVATGANIRADRSYEVADGPGIVMNVRQLDKEGFRGTWGPAGRVFAGGYLCARRDSR